MAVSSIAAHILRMSSSAVTKPSAAVPAQDGCPAVLGEGSFLIFEEIGLHRSNQEIHVFVLIQTWALVLFETELHFRVENHSADAARKT